MPTEPVLRIMPHLLKRGQLRHRVWEQNKPNTPASFYENERFQESIHAQRPLVIIQRPTR